MKLFQETTTQIIIAIMFDSNEDGFFSDFFRIIFGILIMIAVLGFSYIFSLFMISLLPFIIIGCAVLFLIILVVSFFSR